MTESLLPGLCGPIVGHSLILMLGLLNFGYNIAFSGTATDCI
jgi:hypothetical protein